MDLALGVVLLGVFMAGLLGAFVLLARRARRGGTAGAALSGAMAACNEAWHGPAHDAYVEIQAQSDRVTPIESPDNH
jgi:hypothetical protein